jgi:hypothetical protein
MTWYLLIKLLIVILSAGPEEIFMVPKLDKQIKTHVVDKDRRKEIKTVIKEANKEIKVFGKIRKKKLKELSKLSKNRGNSSDQLNNIYQNYFDARLAMQSKLIVHRVNIQDLFEEDEWKLIIEDAVLPSDRLRKKGDKSENKEDEIVNKFLSKLEKEIHDKISDPIKSKNVINALNIFSTTLFEFIDEGQQMNFEDSKLIRNRNATRKDLENYYKTHNALRLKGTKEYFDIRDVMIENTNEKEWKSIQKAFNSLLKS